MGICRPQEELRPDAADPLEAELRRRGMGVEAFPLASITGPRDPGPLRRGARALLKGAFDVVLLTSPRAVNSLKAALDRAREDPTGRAGLPDIEGWVVGSATGRAAAALGLERLRTPSRFVAEGLLEASQGWQPAGRRIFFPRAAEARDVLVEGLVDQGAHVTLVEAYRSDPRPAGARALVAAARSGRLDAVALTAGSQARVLGRVLAEDDGHWAPEDHGAFVAIGPATRGAMLSAGLPEPIVAEPHTLGGVVAALEALRRRVGPASS